MSLVLVTIGAADIVFTADTQGFDGNECGFYKFKFAKLVTVNDGQWILGIAGKDIGKSLEEGVRAQDFKFNKPNVFQCAYAYSEAMQRLYQDSGYDGDCWFLLGGVDRGGQPFLYEWYVKDKEWQLARSVGQHRVAIGAGEHGALYFTTAYHDRNLPLSTRILTAYFSVSEAAKQDPRVGHPVDIGIASKTGARILNEKEIAPIAAASKQIAEQIGAMLKKESQAIEAALTQQEAG